SPDELAGRDAQGHDGVGPPVVAAPGAAEVIGAGAAGRDEDEPALAVHRERRPGIARPGTRRGLARPWDGIPGPAQGTRARVEGAHDPALDVDRAVVPDRRAGDDDVAGDGRGRGDLVLAEVAQIDAAREIDLPVGAEVGTRAAGGAVEGDEPGIERGGEDAQPARLAIRG